LADASPGFGELLSNLPLMRGQRRGNLFGVSGPLGPNGGKFLAGAALHPGAFGGSRFPHGFLRGVELARNLPQRGCESRVARLGEMRRPAGVSVRRIAARSRLGLPSGYLWVAGT
jgi:hypothetical protein